MLISKLMLAPWGKLPSLPGGLRLPSAIFLSLSQCPPENQFFQSLQPVIKCEPCSVSKGASRTPKAESLLAIQAKEEIYVAFS